MMYPFRRGYKWLVGGQWSHLLAALERVGNAPEGTILSRRIASLRLWNGVRGVLMVFLSLGVIGTAVAWFVEVLPGAREAEEATDWLATGISSATGLLTVGYLFLTRLLGQIETDIWALLVIEPDGIQLKRAF